MSGDPLQHVQSGDPLAIRAETFNCLIDAARDFKSRTRHLARSSRSAPANPTVVSVRNDSGSDQPRFAVLGLDRPIVLPTDNLPEFASRPTAVGVEPTSEHRGRWCLLAEPIPAGAIGRAYVAGISPVQLDVQQESDGYAESEAGTTSQLVSGGSGSATILWKEDGTGPGKWAVVRFGDARPAVRKAEMIDTLRQGDASPASAWLMEYVDDAWERTDQEIDVHGDRGFRGVAFGRTPEVDAGDHVDVYFSHEAREWYALVGAWYFHGNVIDDIAEGALGDVRLNVGAGGDTREITVPAYSPYTAVQQDDFVSANWNTFSLHWDIGKFQQSSVTAGCGLQLVDDVLSLKTSDVDGFGLRESDDTEDCELEVDPDDLAGCGLSSDGAGQPLRVDRTSLAGYALTDGAGTCDLDVDTPTLAGCGLVTDGPRNPLKVDPTALAGFGLVAGDGTCDLDVNVSALAGCGLTHDGPGTPLKVSPAALAGFGLVPGDGTCDLDVDTPSLAGCGLLSDGAGQPLKLDALGVAGFGLVAVAPCNLSVDATQLAGCGLIGNVVTGRLDVFSAALAGPGLVPSGLCGLQVNVGCGLALVGDAVVFDAASVAGAGLVASGCTLLVNTGCGIEIAGDAVTVRVSDLIGDGLIAGPGCSISVNAGCGLRLGASGLSVEANPSEFAGDGLVVNATGLCDVLDVDWDAFPGGCGLTVNEGFWDVENATLAGEGLVAGIGCSLAVNTGCGLTVNSGFVEFDPDTVAGDGLIAGIGCSLVVDWAAIPLAEGLMWDGEAVAPDCENWPCDDPPDAGCGLAEVGGTWSVDRGDLIGEGLRAGAGDCDLAVDTGCGLRIEGNAVAVNADALASSDIEPAGGGCNLRTIGYTGVLSVVTAIESDPYDPYAGPVAVIEDWEFVNGLLKSVV